MNRSQALEWLVENVTKWPVSIDDALDIGIADPDGWVWGTNHGDVVLVDARVLFDGVDMSRDMIITKQDWLDATDNMKEKCDE